MTALGYDTYTKPEHKHWIVFVHGAGGSSKTFGRQISTFRKHFNLLLPDLRHHGKSSSMKEKNLSFEIIAQDVLNLMNDLNIRKAHFIGISFGAVIIRVIEKLQPKVISSIILGGGVLKLNHRTHILFRAGVIASRFIPYHTLYSFVAYILMPYKNHAISRKLFIRESSNIRKEAFKLWLSLITELKSQLDKMFNEPMIAPALLIMGKQDFAFRNEILLYCQKYPLLNLSVIQSCGHVCNVEQSEKFNNLSLQFLLNL